MRLATLGGVRLPNHSIRLMCAVLEELGYDVPEALRFSNIPSPLVNDPAGQISGLQELAFQRAFMEMTADRPDIWLDLGSRYRLLSHAHTDYGLLMSTAPSVDAALKIGFEYSDLYYMLAQPEGIFDPSGVQIGWRSLLNELPPELRRFAALRDVALNCTVLADLWGEPFPFDHVSLPLPQSDEPLIRRFLPHTRLDFDADFHCWRWSVRIDERKPPQSDPVLHQFYRQACNKHVADAHRANDVVDRIADILALTQGQVTLADAAQRLGISSRTLQRHLGQRGLSFRDLVVLKRHQFACRLLVETNSPIGQIALKVGYDNISSFNCAFRRHAGMSPSAYRAGLQSS